jgi:hypothetical protein
MLKQSTVLSKQLPIKTSLESATLVLYWSKAMHVPCLDSVLRRNDELM